MSNTQIFDVFNESLFDSSTSEFEDEDGKYEIHLYNGQFMCTVGVSTKIEGGIDENAIIALNRSQFPFKYSIKNGSLQCLAAMFINRRPTKKALSELITMATCNLKTAKEVVIHYREGEPA